VSFVKKIFLGNSWKGVQSVRKLCCLYSMDVMEFESECCRIPTIVGTFEIRRIYKLIQVGFGFIFGFGKPAFIIQCSKQINTQ